MKSGDCTSFPLSCYPASEYPHTSSDLTDEDPAVFPPCRLVCPYPFAGPGRFICPGVLVLELVFCLILSSPFANPCFLRVADPSKLSGSGMPEFFFLHSSATLPSPSARSVTFHLSPRPLFTAGFFFFCAPPERGPSVSPFSPPQEVDHVSFPR